MERESLILQYRNRSLFALTFALFGFIITITGVFSNYLVISSNNYKMPVADAYGSDSVHFGYHSPKEINYPFLADNFPIKTKKYVITYSIGDLLMVSGIMITFIMLVLETWSLFKYGIWKFKKQKNKSVVYP